MNKECWITLPRNQKTEHKETCPLYGTPPRRRAARRHVNDMKINKLSLKFETSFMYHNLPRKGRTKCNIPLSTTTTAALSARTRPRRKIQTNFVENKINSG